ncbi:HIT family protein [Microscilla marina]|uniref:Histidine triad (HIT) protein n=1 Tax=Microscilla marina ATCC 23134 TaxID=313606 RepID=A1ZY53_MICM2|nr:HIT family protein [Microscilla marina]EAY24705.1 histidine triad (HIT) protein [Microscilla marina ATCC 23134]
MEKNNCPFCQANLSTIKSQQNVFAIYDKYPVSPGHTLIIPNRHVANFFELTKEEMNDCWALAKEMKQILAEEYQPDGFNIGINVGEAAGQTIFHVHIHLIPRYKDDVENPAGGVRYVIPEKANYLKNL